MVKIVIGFHNLGINWQSFIILSPCRQLNEKKKKPPNLLLKSTIDTQLTKRCVFVVNIPGSS